jgi:hypothetical protein
VVLRAAATTARAGERNQPQSCAARAPVLYLLPLLPLPLCVLRLLASAAFHVHAVYLLLVV